jgi:hypothetical protein
MDCKLKAGGYMIEGQVMNVALAVQHIEGQGFSKKEALEYIKGLPEET